ncbi:unnamed protein product (macronuclear) [Paramecium tetraurelia]|uniref:Transmembrane protein n=1 Tax=Paramecium tetraurelia TaxID=5888 RepID=A0CPB9_PARTE|nr:uncharacterized protein GSPATT00009027001 [Paramecium tetraurelia]CAK72636.1 unnamed protein product [Paramecium tetraurelia]|eukprot:XP_001440033.1 hypothetical protein (macronuclear) [Paramecium tetraurelia strain d4-2]
MLIIHQVIKPFNQDIQLIKTMLFFILISFLVTLAKAQTGTINPTQQIQYSEYSMAEWNNSLYFTIESKFVPASILYTNKSSSTSNIYLIFCIQNTKILDISTQYVFLTYLKIDNTLKTLTHFFEIQTQTQKYTEKITLQNLNYEGFWYSLEIRNDVKQQQLNITFYQNLNKNILFQKILKNEYFPIQDYFSFYLGESKISRYLGYNQLQGPIKYQILSSTSKFTPQTQTSCSSTSGLALRGTFNYSSTNFYDYTIKDIISKSYGLTTWLKMEKNSNLATNYVNVLHIQQNLIYNYLAQIGGRLAQVSYSITSTKQIVEIIYTTFTFPTIPSLVNNADPTEKIVSYEIPIQYSLYNWHYFSYSFKSNSIYLNINFVLQNYQFSKTLTSINQFSDLNLVINLGGTQYNKSTNQGQFNLPYFYTCLTTYTPKCYLTCATCFGPNKNECLTCSTTSNRQLTKDNICICKSGYLDTNLTTCYSYAGTPNTEELIPLSKRQGYDQEEPNVVCSYGYFLHDNQCFECPKLNRQYFCPECIQYPNTWVLTPICTKKYSQFNQNENNTFVQDITTSAQIILLELDPYNVYLFNDNQLTFCTFCSSLCLTPPYNSQCLESAYYHLNQPVMVICIYKAILVNGECKFCDNDCAKCILINNEPQCAFISEYNYVNKACVKSSLVSCIGCQDNSLYFFNFEQNDCYLCSIANCKYCFQYLKSNPTYNSVFKYSNITYDQEDLEVGCALCYNGFIFNFYTGQCEQNQNLLSTSCSLYYITSSQTSVCITDNDFSKGVQISDCTNYLQNCINCLKITNSQYYCVACQPGYYLQRTYGTCLSCVDLNPTYSECFSSQLNNQNFKYEMTPLLYSLSKQYPGSQKTESITVSVSKCAPGYQQITSQNCNLVDPLHCSTYFLGCRTCENTLEGTKRLSIIDLKCSDCPYYCEYCKPRNQLELQQLNPYLNLTQIQNWLTYRCILKSTTQNFVFLDNEKQLARQCSQDIPKCQLKIKYNFSAYSTFQSLLKSGINNNLFLFYNLKSPTYIDFNINMSATYSDYNSFLSQNKLYNSFIQQIASLKYAKLTYYSQNVQIAFIFAKYKFINFQEILFNQTSILFSRTQQSVLEIESLLHVKLTFENVIISDTAQYPTNLQIIYDDTTPQRSYQIAVQNPDKVNFTNVIIQNITLFNVLFFNLTSVVDKITSLDLLNFKNVTFFNCSFTSTNLISLTDRNNYNKIQFISLRFIDCFFQNSSFLSSMGLSLSASILFQDFVFQNCTMKNSIFVLAPQSQTIFIRDFQIKNCSFYDTDFIRLTSSSTIINLSLKQSFMKNFILIHKMKSAQSIISSTKEDYNFEKIVIYDSQYQQTLFVEIPQYGLEDISVSLLDIQLYELESLDNPGERDYYLFLIQTSFFKANEISLIRSPGCREFSIRNAQSVMITNVNATSSLKQQTFNFDKLKEESLNQILYIEAQIIELRDILILNQLCVDSKIIEVNLVEMIKMKQGYVNLDNLLFSGIQLIKTIFSEFTTVLFISGNVQNNITVSNSQFQEIFLNELVQDTKISSAALAVIQSEQSYVRLFDNVINDVIVLNSSNSILLIQILSLEIVNLTSTNVNNVDYFLEKYQKEQLILMELNSPLVNSQGGLINLQIQYLFMLDSYFINTTGLLGGVLSITTKQHGQLNISNCYFINQSTSIGNAQDGKGGSIFINSENSYLNLHISDTSFINSKSGFVGGVIYFKPSLYQVQISLKNLYLNNVFAIQSSVFSFQMSQLNSRSISYISMKNIRVENHFEEFLQYLSQFNLDINAYQINQDSATRKNYKLFNSQVLVENFQYDGFAFQPIFNFKFAKRMLINNLNIQNITHLSSALVYFENEQSLKSIIQIQSLQISDCSEYQNQQRQYPNYALQIANLNNYFQSLIQGDKLKSLIQMNFQENISSVHVKLLNLNNNNCTFCNSGVFYLNNQQSNIKLKLQELVFLSNICGFDTCFLMKSQGTQKYHRLTKSKFINNKAYIGGAIRSDNFGFLIKQCFFILNQAKTKGGAIYYQNSNQNLKLIETQFYSNQAQIGGAIYDLNIYDNNSDTVHFIENKASLYANNVATQASILQLLINDIPQHRQNYQHDNVTIEEVLYYNKSKLAKFLYFPSGTDLDSFQKFNMNTTSFSKYPLDIAIKTLNFQNEQMIEQHNTRCNFSTQHVKQVGNDEQVFNDTTKTSLYYDDTNSLYNLNYLIFTFDPYLESNNYLRTDVQCDSVKTNNYFLRFYSKSFKCQIGEYYQDNKCLKCDSDQGYYSVEYKATSCQRINIQMIKSTTGALIELQSGYWRPNLRSNQIEQCKIYPSRCLGGWQVSDQSCEVGALGALCEQCDIYNIRGQGSFLNNKAQNCQICGEFSYQFAFMIIETIWIVLLIGLTIKSNHFSNRQLFKLKCLYRHFGTIHKQMIDQTSTLIKLANNIFQILSLISTFQISIFSNLSNTILFLGDSTYMVTYQLDCSIPYITHINYEYAHYILMLLLPILHFALGCFIFFIFLIRKQVTFSKSYIFSSIIYLYCLNQQNIIKWGVSLITKRSLSGIDWIQANVEHRYDTQVHQEWSIRFIYPILILYGILIPLFLFLQLNKVKDSLDDKNARTKYSFLYNEYTAESYYWEIIKMLYKLSIILIVNYYEQFILVKGIIIFLIILIYYKLCQQLQPYKLQSISTIDVKTSFLLSVTIICCLLLYAVQQENIMYLNYLIQMIIIFLILALAEALLHRIFIAYIAKLNLQLDFIRKIILRRFPSIAKEMKCLKPYLLLRKEQEERIQTRFRKIKQYLKTQSKVINSRQVQLSIKESSFIASNPLSQNTTRPFISTERNQNAKMLE